MALELQRALRSPTTAHRPARRSLRSGEADGAGAAQHGPGHLPLPSPSRISTRAAAVALLALFVAGQSGAFWHQATERHAICVEHGDVVEVQQAVHADGARIPARGDAEPADGSNVDAEAASGPEHAHCEIAARRREEVARPALLAARTVGSTDFTVAVLAPIAPPLAASAILRFAPKASPPL